jgi:sec-independent protein translocase protein TatA
MGKLFDSPAALLLILVVILLFGSKKLPDVARGVGRSLRIFKAETKGLMTDEEGQSVPPATPAQIVAPPVATPTAPQAQAVPVEAPPVAVTPPPAAMTPPAVPEPEKTES